VILAYAPQLRDDNEWAAADGAPSGQYLFSHSLSSNATVWKASLRGLSTRKGKITNTRLIRADYEQNFTFLLNSDAVLDLFNKEFLVDSQGGYSTSLFALLFLTLSHKIQA
jgi:hypothetical protein